MTYKISLKGKFHFFSVNTLTLWLPRLTVALKHYVNLALCNTPQTLVMCCVFICICLCVCTCTCVCVYIYSPQELCERLTCRNWFKLNKSKWRLSHSTSSSSAFSMIFFFFTGSYGDGPINWFAIPSNTHSDPKSLVVWLLWYPWYPVEVYESAPEMWVNEAEWPQCSQSIDKGLIIILSWRHRHCSLRRMTGTQQSAVHKTKGQPSL